MSEELKIIPRIGSSLNNPSEYDRAVAKSQAEQQQRALDHKREHEERQAAEHEARERAACARQVLEADEWIATGRMGGTGWSGKPRPTGRYAQARIAEHEKNKQDADSQLAERIFRETTAPPTTPGGRV